MTYCIVERRLALRFKRALRRYQEESGAETIVERRGAERRARDDRRTKALAVPDTIDRRSVRNQPGRRIAERRATLVPSPEPLPLPRRLRANEAAITFAERIELRSGHREDIEAARLIVRFQAGESVFGELYTRFFDRVYNYASAFVDDEATAEWLAQETFLELHDLMPTYAVLPTGFRERLATIMCARAAEHLRRTRGIDLDDLASGDGPARAAAAPDEALRLPDWITDVDLQVLIGRLPLAQRQAVMLRYLFGLSAAEVARACGYMANEVVELSDGALAHLRERLVALGRETAAPSLRLAMLRGRRPARVLQGRRLALQSG